MSLPSQSEKKDKRKNIRPDDSVYGMPAVVLLEEKHWLYIQRRYHMSPRELQVAKLVCQGLINGDIARELKVKPGTVKTHLRSIFNKTRVRNKITLLLRFMDDVNRFFSDSRTAPISIIDREKQTPQTPLLGDMLRKE